MKRLSDYWKYRSVIVACLAFVLLLSGCEFDCSYQVSNQTGETIRIELCQSFTPNRKDLFTITPGKTMEIALHKGGVVTWDHVPPDEYKQSPETPLPPHATVEIVVGDRLMPDRLHYRQYWDFSTKRLHSKYKLHITEDLISTVIK